MYDGGETEKVEMDLLRKKAWKGKFAQKNRLSKPGIIRVNGKCPLAPLEVPPNSDLHYHSNCFSTWSVFWMLLVR